MEPCWSDHLSQRIEDIHTYDLSKARLVYWVHLLEASESRWSHHNETKYTSCKLLLLSSLVYKNFKAVK